MAGAVHGTLCISSGDAEPPPRVIGIDAGARSCSAAWSDDDLAVHHRVHRCGAAPTATEMLDIMVEAVEEARAAAPDVEAVGFGIPSLVDLETGVSLGRTTCRSTTCRSAT